MEKIEVKKEDVQRVNSLIKLQDDLIVTYKNYAMYLRTEQLGLAEVAEERIEEIDKQITKIKSLRLAELMYK